jgi:phosphoribosylformylglycinamidine synthase
VRAIEGLGAACRALDFPIVSGNVSLYNETNGEAILPTPAIGGVGLLDDWRRSASLGFKAEGEIIMLAGAPPAWGTHLGQSIYLRDILGREDGLPPPVDLGHEKRVGDLVRSLIRDGMVTAVHDLSDGGLAVSLAEMAIASGIGATVNQLNDVDPMALFFGEDQGRYLITAAADQKESLFQRAEEAKVFLAWIGSTGGSALTLDKARPVPVSELRARHEGWFPRYMNGH